MSAESESRISFHVSEERTGCPISKVRVRCFHAIEGSQTRGMLCVDATDANGRCSKHPGRLAPGRYRFQLELPDYFRIANECAVVKFIDLFFELMDAELPMHIDVKISDTGYTVDLA